MKKFLDNHMVVTMPLGVWLSWPVCVYIFHHSTIPALPLPFCMKLVTQLLAVCAVIFALMGWMADLTNRARLKKAFLRKLES
jgi:hypothetical protein